MIRMVAPHGCTGASIEGRTLHIEADGTVEIDDRDVGTMLAQGWTLSAASAPYKDERREDLLKRLSALSTDDLEALFELAEAGASELDVSSVTAEQIDGMKRQELFAFLKAANVKAGTPITNEELRARAKAVLSPASVAPAVAALLPMVAEADDTGSADKEAE